MNDHPQGFTFGQNPAYRPSALYFVDLSINFQCLSVDLARGLFKRQLLYTLFGRLNDLMQELNYG